MNEAKKEKTVYTVELAVFAVVYLVLGILIVTNVWIIKGTFRKVMIFVAVLACLWGIVDFFWTLLSAKRRKKYSLLDKALSLPLSLAVLGFNLYVFYEWSASGSLQSAVELTTASHQVFVGVIFLYAAAMLAFEAFYHYRHPIPLLLEAMGEEDGKHVPEETKEEQEKEEEDFLRKVQESGPKTKE